MRTTWAIFRKDFRRFWLLFAGAIALRAWCEYKAGWGTGLDAYGTKTIFSILDTAARLAAGFAVVALVHEDPATGPRATWRARPVPAGSLVAGKLASIVVWLALPMLAIDLVVARAFHLPEGYAIRVALGEGLPQAEFLLGCGFLAAVTESLLQAGIVLLCSVVAWSAVGLVLMLWHGHPGGNVEYAFLGPGVARAHWPLLLVIIILIAIHFRWQSRWLTSGACAVAVTLALPLAHRAYRWIVPSPLLISTAGEAGGTLRIEPGPQKPMIRIESRFPFSDQVQIGLPLIVTLPPGTEDLEPFEVQATFRSADGASYAMPRGEMTGVADFYVAPAPGEHHLGLDLNRSLYAAIGGRLPGGPIVEGAMILQVPQRRYLELAGKRGRLQATVGVMGTTYYVAQWLDLTPGASADAPGYSWKVDAMYPSGGGRVSVDVDSRVLNRPDRDWGNESLVLVNRGAGEFALWDSMTYLNGLSSGLVYWERARRTYDVRHRLDGGATSKGIDSAWLAGARIAILRARWRPCAGVALDIPDLRLPRLRIAQ